MMTCVAVFDSKWKDSDDQRESYSEMDQEIYSRPKEDMTFLLMQLWGDMKLSCICFEQKREEGENISACVDSLRRKA